MAIKIKKTDFQGLYVVEAHFFSDNRGEYIKIFEKEAYNILDLDIKFTELSLIKSIKGTLRGLHFQTQDAQDKLVFSIHGKIFDVAVDLRVDSPTFGKAYCKILSHEEKSAIYIPKGFAHGFLALEDHTIFGYQSTGSYIPEKSFTLYWDDPNIGIRWPKVNDIKYIVSEKDQNGYSLNELLAKGLIYE